MSVLSYLRGDRTPPAPDQRRTVTASAQVVAGGDRGEAQRLRKLRGAQPWQADAWEYRDTIGEIRYAMGFLSHNLSRMRVFAAATALPGEEPLAVAEATGLAPGLAAAADDAMARLASGAEGGLGGILASLGENLEVPGEAMLLGRTVAGGEEWSVRSTDELVSKDDGYHLATEPGARGDSLVPIATDAFVARLWTPHPRWSALADSPMRAVVLGGVCEELLLASRMIRRASRSRLAGAGILVVDSNLDFPAPDTATDDDQYEPFTQALMAAMTTPIGDETSASAVVPIVVRADLSEGKRAMEHIKLTGDVDKGLLDRQEKALRRIAMGLDVPPEVILGMAEVNHWTAWQVDDSTFRYHVEPLVLRGLAALTAGYLRPMLLADGFTAEQVATVCMWYDPVEVVTNPNRAADAQTGHAAVVLSDEVLVRELGFNPDVDMPTDEERIRRMAEARGNLDPPLTEAMLRAAMAELLLTVTRSRTEPDPGSPTPVPLPAPGAPEVVVTPPADTAPAPVAPVPAAVAASADPVHGPVLAAHIKASRRLAEVDRRLRDRLTVAAEAAMRRALERAANRVRSQSNRNPSARAAVAAAGPRGAYAAMMPFTTALTGVDPVELLDGAWAELRGQWDEWTTQARDDAVSLALSMAGVDVADPAVAKQVTDLTHAYQANDDNAWAFLTAGLDRLATASLVDPDAIPTAPGEPPAFPLTPTGIILSLVRGALALLGGLPATHPGLTPDGTTSEGARLPGIAGELLESYLRGAGTDIVGYEWVYGISDRHFEPHRLLDGTTFGNYGDPVLDNPAGASAWPGPTFAPGDHRGCHCDAAPIYADGLNTADAGRAAADASYDDSYLQVLRDIAANDIAAGRLDTDAVKTLVEAERVASSRPSRKFGGNSTITDALAAARADRKTATPAPAPHPTPGPAPELVPGWSQVSNEDDQAAALDQLEKDTGLSRDVLAKFLKGAETEGHAVYQSGNLKVRFTKDSIKDQATRAQVLRDVEWLHQLTPTDQNVAVVIGDEPFGTMPKGVMGFTIRSRYQINVRPTMWDQATDTRLHDEGTTGHFMPSFYKTSAARYVLAHEWGHAVDQGSEDPTYNDRVGKAFISADRTADLSKYGRSGDNHPANHGAEAYAENFAEWIVTGGQTYNKTTQKYAAEFGWPTPGGTA